MARLKRQEVFVPDEIATVHVMNRVVRRCFLMGSDPFSGKNYDHRKQWIEDELERVAAFFAIDLLNFAIMSNHFHLILRSRPDVVQTWSEREVARRWLMLCPKGRKKKKKQSHDEPSESELNSICSNKKKLCELRSRLSDISWWMRLVCQRIAQRANREDEQSGKFWQSRYRAVRLLDEEAILAGAAYVDLNPIRAAIADSLETSAHTSLQRRIEALRTDLARAPQYDSQSEESLPQPADGFLCPLEIDDCQDELGPRPSASGQRCSDKGFLAMPTAAYLELLDWTARRLVPGKSGATSEAAPAMLERLQIAPEVWCQLVGQFGKLFSLVAGKPQHVDSHRSRRRHCRFHLGRAARELMQTSSVAHDVL